MESNSYFSFNSSSSSSNSSLEYQKKSFYNSLHTVRKPMMMMKKPIAPLPPTKPKVYKVEPMKFKEVVQRLTAAPEFQLRSRRRLQEMAPPPLDLSSSSSLSASPIFLEQEKPAAAAAAEVNINYFHETAVVERKSCGALSPLGFNFSLFSPLLSPGTLSLLEQST